MDKGKRVLKLERGVAREDADTCRNKHSADDIEAYLFQLEIVLAQVFITKRHKKKESCRACQTGEQTEQPSEPPATMAYLVEAEQDKAQKKRLVVTSRKEEGVGEDREIKQLP